jgi:phosphoribosyl-dephospho-CoA transferase
MADLRRHQLASLSDVGWAALQSCCRDDLVRECLTHWAERRLPLVVTQQSTLLPKDKIALGLPAPLQWECRKLALLAPLNSALCFHDFPEAAVAESLLPFAARDDLLALFNELQSQGIQPRVYGSYGWQSLTGLPYLHVESDFDLRLDVTDQTCADAAAHLLQRTVVAKPRLDGELVFPDGAAVAWREWLQWRMGRVDRILVKRLHGATLEQGEAWLSQAEVVSS